MVLVSISRMKKIRGWSTLTSIGLSRAAALSGSDSMRTIESQNAILLGSLEYKVH